MKKLLLSAMLLAAGSSTYAQWTTQNTNFQVESRGISEIMIVDANTVWALAYDGATPANNIQDFTRTSNGGTTWTSGVVELFDTDQNINNLQPLSATNAWVSALNPAEAGGAVYNTTDGGDTWTNKNPTGYITPGDSFLNVVHFFNATTGFSQGDPIGSGVNRKFEIYRTTDSGNTWTALTNTPSPLSNEYGLNGGNVAAGNSFWFVTDQGKLYRTTDMGLTWTKLNTPVATFSSLTASARIHFANDNVGILIGTTSSGSTLYKTTDGGTTWSTGTPYTAGYAQMDYIKGTTTLVSTNPSTTPPTVAISNDNATTWTVIDSGTQRNAIAFFNGTTGWAGGFTSSTLTGGMFKYAGPSLGLNDKATTNAKLKAYPNPTGNVLNLSGVSINQVVAYDLLGKQVMNTSFAGQNEVTLDVSSLQTGMYLLSVTNDLGATETIKFAKK